MANELPYLGIPKEETLQNILRDPRLTPEEEAEIEGQVRSEFLERAKSDIFDMALSGFLSSPAGLSYHIGTTPIEELAEEVRAIPGHMLGTVTRPFDPKVWEEHPVHTALDLLMLGTGAGALGMEGPAIGRALMGPLKRGTLRGLGTFGEWLDKVGFAEPLAQRRAGIKWIPKAEAGAKAPHPNLGLVMESYLDPKTGMVKKTGRPLVRDFKFTGFIKEAPKAPRAMVGEVVESTTFGDQRFSSVLGPQDRMFVYKQGSKDIGYMWITPEEGGFTVRKVEVIPEYRAAGKGTGKLTVLRDFRQFMEDLVYEFGRLKGFTDVTPEGQAVLKSLTKQHPEMVAPEVIKGLGERGSFSTKDIKDMQRMVTSHKSEVRAGLREAKATPAETIAREGRRATKQVLEGTTLTEKQIDQLRAIPELVKAFPPKQQASVMEKLAKKFGVPTDKFQYLIDLAMEKK